jgi:hypothetical protein
MAKADNTGSKAQVTLEDSLQYVSEKLAQSKSLRTGDILLTLSGSGAGSYVIECREAGASVVKSSGQRTGAAPLIEVIGDAKSIHAILAGRKDAREQFLAGGFRVRGDLRYLSDLALELGILKEPL